METFVNASNEKKQRKKGEAEQSFLGNHEKPWEMKKQKRWP